MEKSGARRNTLPVSKIHTYFENTCFFDRFSLAILVSSGIDVPYQFLFVHDIHYYSPPRRKIVQKLSLVVKLCTKNICIRNKTGTDLHTYYILDIPSPQNLTRISLGIP